MNQVLVLQQLEAKKDSKFFMVPSETYPVIDGGDTVIKISSKK
ncbi:hypothetical protein VQL36_04105 [Chengkuizengella sp. SCS-71B]